MAITILSDPSHVIQVSPEIKSRWLATESQNNFRLQRKDFAVTGQSNSGGFLSLTFADPFIGNEGDTIAVYNAYNQAMHTGTITSIASPATSIVTDIPWVATMDIDYMNDNTLYGGYYFEGKLTVNDVVQTLTVIAFPDSFGKADLDVSGILRIKVSTGKTGDYTSLLMSETTKSGKFTFAYRACWYGSNESYTEETNTWYYAEAVRSEEQGSNLYEYTPNESENVPFLNAFDQPVFFPGLPFDLSFVCSDLADQSPAAQLQVIIKHYNSSNTLLSTVSNLVDPDTIKGRVCSLNIDPAGIEASAAYLTAEINIV